MSTSSSLPHHLIPSSPFSSLVTRHSSFIGFTIILLILLPIYLLTLQTRINGAEHYFMIDVGETQAVLNLWGTLHATGYPLYVMVSSGLVALLRDGFGVSAAAAPAVTSLLYGVIALGLFYALVVRILATSDPSPIGATPASNAKDPTPSPNASPHHPITSSPSSSSLVTRHSSLPPSSPRHSFLIPMLVTILFGLLRTVWIHSVIAEIYSFGLVILLALLWLAFPKPAISESPLSKSVAKWRGDLGEGFRIYLLALIGGIGVFHHRAIIMAAPALLVAVWGDLWNPAAKRFGRLLRVLVLSVMIGLLGFLPYLYLPARANADALWVYGEPGTWNGFWDQFTGREASRFIGTVQGWDGLLANVGIVNDVIITDLTLPGVIAGLIGLLAALANPFRRRIAIILILNALVPYLFHVTYYTDILSALILPILVSMALGWALLALWIFDLARERTKLASSLEIAAAVVLGGVLLNQNVPFIRDLTTDPTGLETIALVEQAPAGSAVMLDWGPRYFAVAFAHDVEGKLQGITPVDHRADFPVIVQAEQSLLTPEFTFYNRPVSWWVERLGTPVYLHAVAPRLVRISTQPEQAAVTAERIAVGSERVSCTADSIRLDVAWIGPEPSARDYSVFVHLLDADDNILAQADQAAPVYGWRPVSGWLPGEIVRDVYAVERAAGAVSLRYGLYYQAADGTFVNDLERRVEVVCGS